MPTNNDQKKVDGIKRIDKEEIKKSRRIVLDAIGDDTKPPPPPTVIKKVDSISLEVKPKEKVKPKPPPPPPPPKETKSEQRKLSAEDIAKRKKWREQLTGFLDKGAKEETPSVAPKKEEPVPRPPVPSPSPAKRRPEIQPLIVKPSPKSIPPHGASPKPIKTVLTAEEIAKQRKWWQALTGFFYKREAKPKTKPPQKPKAKMADLRRQDDVADDFVSASKGRAQTVKEKPVDERVLPKADIESSQVKAEPVRKKKDKKQELERKKRLKLEIKRAEEEKKKKQADERVKLRLTKEKAKAKRKELTKEAGITRQKNYQEFKKRLATTWQNSIKLIKKQSRHTTMIVFIAVAILTLIYTTFTILIIKTEMDNSFTRRFSLLFLVPAYITNNGIVEYYDYKDIKDEIRLNYQNESELETVTKITVIERMILDQLLIKHGLSPYQEAKREEILKSLSERIVFDHEINQVGIKRIKKIQELIKEENEFVQVANKYGDEQDQLTITKINEAQYSFSGEVKQLTAGEISKIIYAPEGYYIFRVESKTPDAIALSYVFIQAKTLDQYLNDTIRGFKLWSLVE